MKATIVVDGLRVKARHGVYPQEREVGNVFEVSMMLDYPPALKAAVSDCVDDTLNYARAIELVQRVMAEPSSLLEHVAWRIHEALMFEYPGITGGRIVVSKLAPPLSAELSAVRFVLEF